MSFRYIILLRNSILDDNSCYSIVVTLVILLRNFFRQIDTLKRFINPAKI